RTWVPPRGASRSEIEPPEASAATAEGSGQVGRRSHRPRTEKDPFRMENSWPTSRILPLRTGQSRPKAGCERKGFIYGQALNSLFTIP
ncbi:MAG: hypothetical protein ACLQJ7_04835, partial [Syntrophobacteraceae bacterium]